MLLTILSGILLALAYPVFNLEFLAFVGFVPLFVAVKNKNLIQSFLLSFITGIIFFLIVGYWLIHVTLVGLILLVPYLALYFGLFGLVFKLICGADKDSRWAIIIVPSAWILLEWLRMHLFPGFGWALLGYSQYLNLPLIQIADITGVWGVSFLLMMVNVAVYNVIARRATPKQSRRLRGHKVSEAISIKGLLRFARNDNITVLLPFLLVFLSLGYGFYKLHNSKLQAPNSKLRISVIQGNIPQNQKWDRKFADFILDRYVTLTNQAAEDKPDLVILPETSMPGLIDEDPQLLAAVLGLAKKIRAPILIGAVTLDGDRAFNSAVLISAEGRIIGQYDKLRLVPFGEYVPLDKVFPLLRRLIGIPIGDFTPGARYTVFKEPRNFSALICFEDTFPGLSRRFVKEGAKFLVNITNDAWFKYSSAPYQHVQASVFRAVENRVPVVRAANTGLSCFIDRCGRIYDTVAVDNKDIFVTGYKTSEVKL